MTTTDDHVDPDADVDLDLETWDQFILAVRYARTQRPDLTLAEAHRDALQDWIALTAVDAGGGPFQPARQAGPVEPPAGFARHVGPRPPGIVTLDARLWPDRPSPQFDLSLPAALRVLYETVLQHGTSDDIHTHLDPTLLLREWDQLTVNQTVKELWGPWVARQRAPGG